ncbi:hypothetical protein PVT68_00595 [Microbulbifer bruguierae]|uniref:Lipoprotein n=1 Tax=Microbulbifer bruguierae TaxID=3029061 RepID=A0ABY8NDD0_9GAMM|nr:hypothetical protein [Microbulbifer bruguierae]WGL16813.1 hypothetical protein PVT68_00595 [Microbulbifer bruguierae]
MRNLYFLTCMILSTACQPTIGDEKPGWIEHCKNEKQKILASPTVDFDAKAKNIELEDENFSTILLENIEIDIQDLIRKMRVSQDILNIQKISNGGGRVYLEAGSENLTSIYKYLSENPRLDPVFSYLSNEEIVTPEKSINKHGNTSITYRISASKISGTDILCSNESRTKDIEYLALLRLKDIPKNHSNYTSFKTNNIRGLFVIQTINDKLVVNAYYEVLNHTYIKIIYVPPQKEAINIDEIRERFLGKQPATHSRESKNSN